MFFVFSLNYCHEAVHKNNSVSGRPAGWLKKVRLETFFLHFSKNGQYFLRKKEKWKKKKKIAAARLASILATRCTGNRIFCMDSLKLLIIVEPSIHTCTWYQFNILCYVRFIAERSAASLDSNSRKRLLKACTVIHKGNHQLMVL